MNDDAAKIKPIYLLYRFETFDATRICRLVFQPDSVHRRKSSINVYNKADTCNNNNNNIGIYEYLNAKRKMLTLKLIFFRDFYGVVFLIPLTINTLKKK